MGDTGGKYGKMTTIKLVPTSQGINYLMPKIEADKLLSRLLDDQDCYWGATRVADDMEHTETRQFTTLRAAIIWILRYECYLPTYCTSLLDAIPLATELYLLYGTGMAISDIEIPKVWETTITARGTPAWCM